MTVGNTTYVISHVPLSSIPSSSNAIHPPHSCGPSSQNFATSNVRTTPTRDIVSQIQVPPIVLGGRIPTSGGHIAISGTSIPTYGVSHGISHGASYGPYYGPQYAQSYSPYGYGYQQPAYSPNYDFVAPHSQGTPHYGASMPPYTGQTGGGHYGQDHGGNQTYVN